MTCYLFFLLSGTVNFLDSSSSFKSLIAHIDQLANHRGRLIYTLHKKSTSDRPCIHGSAWGRQFRQYVGKNSHTAITLRREQRCTEGTVLGDWHCTRQLRFFRNPKKTKSSTLSPALSYSLSTNKHNNLFSKRWTSPQKKLVFLQAPLHCASALCEKEHQRSVPTNSRFVVCLFVLFLFCFEGRSYNIMMSYINATFVLMKTKKTCRKKNKGRCLLVKKKINHHYHFWPRKKSSLSPFLLFLACLSPLSLPP